MQCRKFVFICSDLVYLPRQIWFELDHRSRVLSVISFDGPWPDWPNRFWSSGNPCSQLQRWGWQQEEDVQKISRHVKQLLSSPVHNTTLKNTHVLFLCINPPSSCIERYNLTRNDHVSLTLHETSKHLALRTLKGALWENRTPHIKPFVRNRRATMPLAWEFHIFWPSWCLMQTILPWTWNCTYHTATGRDCNRLHFGHYLYISTRFARWIFYQNLSSKAVPGPIFAPSGEALDGSTATTMSLNMRRKSRKNKEAGPAQPLFGGTWVYPLTHVLEIWYIYIIACSRVFHITTLRPPNTMKGQTRMVHTVAILCKWSHDIPVRGSCVNGIGPGYMSISVDKKLNKNDIGTIWNNGSALSGHLGIRPNHTCLLMKDRLIWSHMLRIYRQNAWSDPTQNLCLMMHWQI